MTDGAIHSAIGASSMYRWSACPGSVRLSEGIESKSSSYAEDGTNAHALAAYCLDKIKNPGSMIGKKVTIDGRKFEVTREMAHAVQVYLDEARSYHRPGVEYHFEKAFDLSKVHPGCFGTADCVIWQPDEKTLTVIDYKHGAGIPVNVTGNPQLQYYGLGALLACGYPAEKVRLVVVQPRCDHSDGPVREWVIDAIDLMDFQGDLKAYAKATEAPDAPLVAGDHCRFCPAAQLNPKTMETYCPALTEKRQEVAKMEFSTELSYDPEKLRLALDSREVVKAWLKNLDEFAYREAEQGRCPPGYKLVEKRPTRKWRDEGETIEFLQDNFSTEELAEMYEPVSLRSPAQLEGHLAAMKDFAPGIKAKTKRKEAARDLLAAGVIAESSGHTLVPESDKRPPAKPSAADEFAKTDDLLEIPTFLRRDKDNTKKAKAPAKTENIFN